MQITDRERQYVMEVLDTQFRASSGGKMTRRLEEKFAETFGVKYAIAHVNGTATLHSALVAAGVGHGDEVIVPPLTMAATSLAVLHAGAVPVFADVDASTFTIDPADIERQVTPRTRAIIPVSLYGLAPDMDPIMDIASRHKLTVIEDAAQCFLGYYKGRLVGTIGHLGSFSFQSSKHMTSGEGGIVTTNDIELADRVRRFGSLGYAAVSARDSRITKAVIQDPAYERHSSIGWNYRMAELCAAVALGQVERLSELVAQRVKVAGLYAEAARGSRFLAPQATPEGYRHSYWTYVSKLENHGEFTWRDFRSKYVDLGGDGIYGAWQLTYLEPAFRDLKPGREGRVAQVYARGLCPVAESIQPRLLQFITNYWDMGVAESKAEALYKTIRHFETAGA